MSKLDFMFMVLFSTIVLSCATEENKIERYAKPVENINYTPKMVGSNVISRSYFEGHASVSPTSDEIYFAVYTNDHGYSTIAYSKKIDDKWIEPEIAGFSGNYNDGSPSLSPDGKRLFFSSRRPVDIGRKINSKNDIWYVERALGKWSTPTRLNESINTDFNEFSPSVDRYGNLYFCSDRPNGFGDMDVYLAKFVDGEYQYPILLDSAINSRYHEGNVGVSPDGSMLFIMVQHKPGDYGYDDIHYSIKEGEKWSNARNIGSTVNTPTYDFSPKVSPDGKTLYFSSRINRDYTSEDLKYTYQDFEAHLNSPLNGLGNIYKIELNQLDLKNE